MESTQWELNTERMAGDLFITEIGSTIWDMKHAGSDTDLFQVYVVSTEDILKGVADNKSRFTQNDGIDISSHEVGKVVEQLIKGNLNFIIGVMSPVVIRDGMELYGLKKILSHNLGRNCYHSIHGLAVHNYKKYIESGKDDSESRCNKILRVLQFGKDLLDTRPVVRHGKKSFDIEFKFKSFSGGTSDDILSWIYLLDESYKYSELPERVNEEPFREWLYQIRLKDWKK